MNFVLNSKAAITCPVKTHNKFDNTVLRSEQTRLSKKDTATNITEFTAEIEKQLLSYGHELVNLNFAKQSDLCLAEMRNKTKLILKPTLPPDELGHRIGHPFLLIHDQVDGYYPVIVKHHRVLSRCTFQSDQLVSSLSNPTKDNARVVTNLQFHPSRERDLLQLSHYWRILQACGFAAKSAYGAIIGNDFQEQITDEICLVWADLTKKCLKLYPLKSATGLKTISPLKRYDHEYKFRLRVAQLAMKRQGNHDDPPACVSPIVSAECQRCLWWPVCHAQLPKNDIGLCLTKPALDSKELRALKKCHISSVSDLANANLESLLNSYLPQVRHRLNAESRLRLVTHKANLLISGVHLERLTQDKIAVPAAEIEVDFDIEATESGEVYLWGFLVNDNSETKYISFTKFKHFEKQDEVQLFNTAAYWMLEIINNCDVKFYHYSKYELVAIHSLASRSTDGHAKKILSFIDSHFVDLFATMKQHFLGVHGLGLKSVAKYGPGFSWRDNEPSGLNSLTWFKDALEATDCTTQHAMIKRILQYNEDDVRATKALRDWLRQQPSN